MLKINTPVNLILLLVLALAGSVPAQIKPGTVAVPAASALFVRQYKLESRLMGRQMPYHIIVPHGYDSAENRSKKYPVIYLLHGLYGHYDNWGGKTEISRYAAPYDAIIVMPEGGDGWYTDSAIKPDDRFETYIARELVPEIDKKFRTAASRRYRFIAGLSMGGYGAIKFGLKYPEMFALVGSFSGALGAASWTTETTWLSSGITSSVMNVYGAAESPTRRENDIFKIVREATPEKIKSLPFIYFDCGTEDFLFQNNRDFAALLIEKKVRHEFRQLPGAHTWDYWDRQVQEFLRLTERYLNQAKAKAA